MGVLRRGDDARNVGTAADTANRQGAGCWVWHRRAVSEAGGKVSRGASRRARSSAGNAGGRVVITDWCDDYVACRLCNVYLRLTSKAHYKTYRQAECAALLKEAGHALARIERYKINWLWGLMTAVAEKPR